MKEKIFTVKGNGKIRTVKARILYKHVKNNYLNWLIELFLLHSLGNSGLSLESYHKLHHLQPYVMYKELGVTATIIQYLTNFNFVELVKSEIVKGNFNSTEGRIIEESEWSKQQSDYDGGVVPLKVELLN